MPNIAVIAADSVAGSVADTEGQDSHPEPWGQRESGHVVPRRASQSIVF